LITLFLLLLQVGQYKRQLETQGWVYEMEVSFVEIYNEQVRDLLRSLNPDKAAAEVSEEHSMGWAGFLMVCGGKMLSLQRLADDSLAIPRPRYTGEGPRHQARRQGGDVRAGRHARHGGPQRRG